MPNIKRNALAELAEDLEVVKAILDWEYHPKGLTVAEKAQRIVAELAKVSLYESLYCKGSFTADVNTVDVILKCREIAEEGNAS